MLHFGFHGKYTVFLSICKIQTTVIFQLESVDLKVNLKNVCLF